MNKCTIRFIRKDQGSKKDDILIIYEDEELCTYRLVFRPAQSAGNEFYLEHDRAIQYVGEILNSLQYDADPFQHVQVDTPLHPTILYKVEDLQCACVRSVVEDMVSAAIRRPVVKIA